MDFPGDLRYSEQHEWVRLDGERATVGITDYAQDALGDVVYVEVPTPGTSVNADERVCEVESTKSVSDIFAPVTGTILEVNDTLGDAPEQLNSDPYGGGWIFAMEVADAAEVEALMDTDAYRAFVE